MTIRSTAVFGAACLALCAGCGREGRDAAAARAREGRRLAPAFVAPPETLVMRGVYRRDRDQSRFRLCAEPRGFVVSASDSIFALLDANVDWHAPRPTTMVFVEVTGDTVPGGNDTTVAGTVTVVGMNESRELASGECVPVRPKFPHEPPESAVLSLMRAALGRDSALARPANLSWGAAWLNPDQRGDLLVLAKAPPLCELAGCTLFAFEGIPNGYRLVSRTTGVSTPVQIRPEATFGWQDIQVKVSGGAFGLRDVVLKYRDGHYPRAANFEPPPGGRRGGVPTSGETVLH